MVEQGGRSAPATAKGEATRARLVRVAAQVFAARGYTSTSLNDLIAASGLTKGAFYFHFRSKAELALAVLADQDGRWLRQVSQEVLRHERAADQLRALIPALVGWLTAEPGGWSVVRLTRDLAADPRLAAEAAKPMTGWIALVATIIRRGQAEGDLRPELDPDQVAVVLVGAFNGIKSLVDVVAPADAVLATFADRARTLAELIEVALSRSR